MIVDACQVMFSPKNYMRSLGENGVHHHRDWWGVVYIVVMSTLPVIGFYYGCVEQGWVISGRRVSLTSESAIGLGILFYLTLIAVTVTVGLLLSWMSHTYHAVFKPMQGIETAGLVATPVYVAGLAAIYPVFWLDLVLATCVAMYSARLLNIAIAERLKLPEELAFLYTLAMIAAVLVIVIAVLGASTFGWTFISAPVFTEALSL